MRSPVGIALLLCAFAVVGARAQTALEPEEGGVDFKLQGEYLGKLETVTPMGVQVIALGDGKFKAVFLAGGLPGQGSTGARVEADGSLTADKTAVFSGNGYTATIAADGQSIYGKTDKQELFTLLKTIRQSPSEGWVAPAGAIVLFSGSGVDAWKDGTATMDARKLFKPEGTASSSGAISKQAFQDFSLHLEFREPFMPAARFTRRGNSGIYLQSRYEVQVLDSFGASLTGRADSLDPARECGAIWEHVGPKVNMAYPPLSWQTYDITFQAARFDGAGKRTQKAVVSVIWNGVLVHDKWNLADHTLVGENEGPAPMPFRFQAYGDPVYYRNIWITEGTAAARPVPRRSPLRHGRAGAGTPAFRSVDGRRPSPRPAFGLYLLSTPTVESQSSRGTAL